MRVWLLAAVVLFAPASFAARITDVADAADERHPLEVDLDATYRFMRSTATITREVPGAAGTQLNDELKYVRQLSSLDLRFAVGLWRDLELHVLAPLALSDSQSWAPAGGTSTLATNTISISGCGGAGSCAAVQPIVNNYGPSKRVGFFDPTIGVAWNPINEERELRLKPELFPEGRAVSTWAIGFDWTLPMPGGKLNDPSRYLTYVPDQSPGRESRQAHVLTLWTAFSKRYKVLEPFVGFSASVPFAGKDAWDNCDNIPNLADVAKVNCKSRDWIGSTGYKPPIEGQVTFGAELVAAEDLKADQRLAFEIRGDLRWHGPARDYTQVSDALGKLNYADEYVTSSGTVGIYGRVARWAHVRVYGTISMDTAHFLTHEDIGDDKDHDGKITVSGGTGAPAPDQNPTYDFRVDQVGHRLRAEPAITYGFAGTLSINF